MSAAFNDIELYDAPLVDASTQSAVSGYKILNVVKRVPCLDWNRSIISYSKNGTEQIAAIPRLVVALNLIPSSVQVFRLDEFVPVLLVAESLFRQIYDSGVKGIAFGECEVS
jgi:hypothetical protein